MFFKPLTTPLLSVIAFGLVVLSSCASPVASETVTIPTETANPGATGKPDEVILPFDTGNVWLVENVFPKTLSTASLNKAELKLIDSLMEAFVTSYNLSEAQKKWEAHKKLYSKDTSGITDFMFDMKNYKKQYIAVTNAKGEKEVWVNCFCKSIEKTIEFKDWKDYVIRVYDGGSCFFNLKLNLDHKNHYDLRINSGG
jgi:hypothetical protein